MRIAIIGAGAIGSYLGARLAQHGHEVIAQGRAEHVAAINANGLIVRALDGSAERVALRAVTALTEAPDFTPELILLTVKTQDVAEACAGLVSIAPAAPIVTFQNGLRADEIAGEVVGRARIVGGVVMCAVAYLRPGEIEAQFPGWLTVGAAWDRPDARVRRLAEVLRDAAPTFITPNLRGARWSKLISNLNNGLCAATGLSLPALARSPLGRRLSLALMREGIAVARAQGVRLDHGLHGLSPRMLRENPSAALVAVLQGVMPSLLGVLPAPLARATLLAAAHSRLGRLPVRGSTWQSIARGRQTEIEYLNGEISRRGLDLGVPTPVNDLVTRAVREAADRRQFFDLPAVAPQQGDASSLAHTRGGVA